MYNPFCIQGKTILVTGASSGIGRAIAIACSKMGATVIVSGRNKERIKETLQLLDGNTHTELIADLSTENGIQTLMEAIESIDGIVHSAGLIKTVPFQFTSNQVIKEVFDVNFTAPTLLTALLVKNKKLKKGGSVVFISSINGVSCSYLGSSIYAASKGALNGLIKSMALDLAPKQIRVNSINPGMIDTGILDEGVITKEQLEEDKKKYPLKRYGKPEEVAYAAIYLLSDASSWTTGSNIILDGGYTLN